MAFMAHNWVEITVLPVSVEMDGDNLVTSSSEEGIEISEDERQIICWDCKQHLSHDLFDTACTHAPTADQLSNS